MDLMVKNRWSSSNLIKTNWSFKTCLENENNFKNMKKREAISLIFHLFKYIYACVKYFISFPSCANIWFGSILEFL